jgi:hypothetical protein
MSRNPKQLIPLDSSIEILEETAAAGGGGGKTRDGDGGGKTRDADGGGRTRQADVEAKKKTNVIGDQFGDLQGCGFAQ